MLSHLIYISKRDSTCTQEEITKILEYSQNYNRDNDITGVLLYSDRAFIQHLEGEHDIITALFNKVKKDPRHSDVSLFTISKIHERSFPSWYMASKFIDLEQIEFKSNTSKEDKILFKRVLSGKTNNEAISIIKKLFMNFLN
jgi:hypothetical protein